jgi:hypothetical protein
MDNDTELRYTIDDLIVAIHLEAEGLKCGCGDCDEPAEWFTKRTLRHIVIEAIEQLEAFDDCAAIVRLHED